MSNTIEKRGLPNEFTAGEVGDIYIDIDTGFKFKCVGKAEIKHGKKSDFCYTWLPIKNKVDANKILEDIKNAKY